MTCVKEGILFISRELEYGDELEELLPTDLFQ